MKPLLRALSGPFLIAFRFLNPPKQLIHFRIISIISTLSISLGCMALVCALSIENGLSHIINESFFSLTPHLWVYNKDRTPLPHPEVVEQNLRAIPLVIAAAPYAERKGIVNAGNSSTGVIIAGIDPTREKELLRLNSQIAKGTFLSPDTGGLPQIVMGSALAGHTNLAVDSVVTLLTLRVDQDSNPIPTFTSFRICGLFTTEIYETEMNSVFISLSSARKLFGIDSTSAHCVRARLKDPFDFRKVQSAMEAKSGYTVETWVDRAGLLFASMKMERKVLILAFSMIILIGIQGLSGTVRLLFLSKRKQIGILSALGMSGGGIRSVFFFNGLLRGTLASSAGVLLGLCLCLVQQKFGIVKLPYDIYVFSQVPVEVVPLDIATVLLGTIAAGALISFLSSRRVSVPNQYFRE